MRTPDFPPEPPPPDPNYLKKFAVFAFALIVLTIVCTNIAAQIGGK